MTGTHDKALSSGKGITPRHYFPEDMLFMPFNEKMTHILTCER